MLENSSWKVKGSLINNDPSINVNSVNTIKQWSYSIIPYNTYREWHRNERADYLLDRDGWPCGAEPEGVCTSTSVIWVTSLLWWQI